MGKKGKELTYKERLQIEMYLSEKYPIARIAALLNRHRSTIYKEIKRGTYLHRNSDWTETKRYSCDLAHGRYKTTIANRGTNIKLGKDHQYANYLEKKVLEENYSPEAVLGELKATKEEKKFKTKICVRTFYNYIRNNIFRYLTQDDLPVVGKRKRKKKKIKRMKRLSAGKSIEERPKNIDTRKEFGHWEMDTVRGKQGKSKCVLLVLTERKTRMEIIRKLADGTAKSVVNELDHMEQEWGAAFPGVFKTITVDNGSEFSAAQQLERSCLREGKRTDVYYCHPYCSYERGSNENINRMIRRVISKGSNFDNKTPEEIRQIQNWINHYPRGIHQYENAQRLFMHEIRKLGIRRIL